MSPMSVLKNPRHEDFARHVAQGTSGTEAYLRAGYQSTRNQARKHASRLKAEPHISERIKELKDLASSVPALSPRAQPHRTGGLAVARAKAVERYQLSREFVVSNLMEIAERCMQHAVITDAVGNPVRVEAPDGQMMLLCSFRAREATRALELLGKELGMFIDRHDHRMSFEHRLRQMTPEQRDADALELARMVREKLLEAPLIENEADEVENDNGPIPK